MIYQNYSTDVPTTVRFHQSFIFKNQFQSYGVNFAQDDHWVIQKVVGDTE